MAKVQPNSSKTSVQCPTHFSVFKPGQHPPTATGDGANQQRKGKLRLPTALGIEAKRVSFLEKTGDGFTTIKPPGEFGELCFFWSKVIVFVVEFFKWMDHDECL